MHTGQEGDPKDLTKIIAAHKLPYAAQASPHNWKDLIAKAAKGFEANGPSFLNIITPCPRGWRYDGANTIEMAKLAVETGMWPLYEYENGKWTLTGETKRIAEGKMERRPLADWAQGPGPVQAPARSRGRTSTISRTTSTPAGTSSSG